MLQKPSTKTRIETLQEILHLETKLQLQKPSTKTRIETRWPRLRMFFLLSVAKAVYKNKDWNLRICVSPAKCMLCCKSRLRKQGLKHFGPPKSKCKACVQLQKPSTKTRIETEYYYSDNCSHWEFVTKAVYKNKDWNMIPWGPLPQGFFLVAKAVYKNKDWNFLRQPLLAQESYKVAKAVYKNKDWNRIQVQGLHTILPQRCKSRLQKQGLKLDKFRTTANNVFSSCKSRLQKQGLKRFLCLCSSGYISSVAKAVYKNKDWNSVPGFVNLVKVVPVAKAVYKNKDWNLEYPSLLLLI